jgi:hypothetical protein
VQRVGTPYTHALVTAVGSYLLAQAVFVTIRLLSGDDVSWFRVVFTMSFALLAGLIGGVFGSRLQASGYHPSVTRRDGGQ